MNLNLQGIVVGHVKNWDISYKLQVIRTDNDGGLSQTVKAATSTPNQRNQIMDLVCRIKHRTMGINSGAQHTSVHVHTDIYFVQSIYFSQETTSAVL